MLAQTRTLTTHAAGMSSVRKTMRSLAGAASALALIGAITVGLGTNAQAAVNIPVGDRWFCDSSFQDGVCTTEMCTFRDSSDALIKLDVEVFPVSGDYIFSHQEWAKHHNLPFKLLGDHTREFGKKMGVYMPENGMLSRSVFVVGKDGKFEYIDYEYSVKDGKDFEELKKALEKSE